MLFPLGISQIIKTLNLIALQDDGQLLGEAPLQSNHQLQLLTGTQLPLSVHDLVDLIHLNFSSFGDL